LKGVAADACDSDADGGGKTGEDAAEPDEPPQPARAPAASKPAAPAIRCNDCSMGGYP